NSLEVLWLGSGIISVAEGAFNECQSLKTITFPEGTTTFTGMIFGLCSELERIYIPATVVNIANNVILSNTGCPNAIIVTPEGSAAEASAIEQEVPYETY
ncbi:MAG: leucine-rich repeat protein, partial [Faecalibacterium sp.]